MIKTVEYIDMSLQPTTYLSFLNACETTVDPEKPSKTLLTFNPDVNFKIFGTIFLYFT